MDSSLKSPRFFSYICLICLIFSAVHEIILLLHETLTVTETTSQGGPMVAKQAQVNTPPPPCLTAGVHMLCLCGAVHDHIS